MYYDVLQLFDSKLAVIAERRPYVASSLATRQTKQPFGTCQGWPRDEDEANDKSRTRRPASARSSELLSFEGQKRTSPEINQKRKGKEREEALKKKKAPRLPKRSVFFLFF